ncbi:MAG: FecR family protein [Chitinophagaceae bacterium]|nr:FecR family protein [Chitinophagaceae bacterium]
MEELKDLIRKYNEGACSPEEKAFVEHWYQFFDWKSAEEASDAELLQMKEEVWALLKDKGNINTYEPAEKLISPIRHFRPWRYLTAAMIIAAVAGIGLFRFYFNDRKAAEPISTAESVSFDPAPGASKARLILADGKALALDSLATGSLTEADGTVIDQQSGRLVYKKNKNAPDEIVFNTLVVPRGGEYQLLLSDGSKVWLNAASSIRYPTRFASTERVVYLNGEAYFDVEKNTKSPFKVITEDGAMIEALGTRFDVMAYDDEKSVKAVLESGIVRVTRENRAVLLSPRQEAEWQREKKDLRVKEADLEKTLAWKNGMIQFREDDIASIMRQIARWYDVEVIFSGQRSGGRYNGYIRRQSKLSKVLEILKEAGVQCRLENRKLIVE